MKVEQSATPTRRAFLKSVAAAGAGAVLAAGTHQALSIDNNNASAEETSSTPKGYNKTNHVKAYYASARL